jgi:quercetin dioxygenase-like cupin family protein
MLDQSKQAMPRFFFTLDGCTVNTFHIDKAGEGHPKHVHNHDHVTQVHSGRLLVTMAHTSFVMTKDSQPINFPANEWHELEALDDNTVFCNIFAAGKEAQTLLASDM